MVDNRLEQLDKLDGITRRELCLGGLSLCMLLGPLSGCSQDNPHRKRRVRLEGVKEVGQGLQLFPVARLALIREGQALRAVSIVCTHQTCVLAPAEASTDSLFVCPCHGSRFDRHGMPVSGPAVTQLAWYQIERDQDGTLCVLLDSSVGAAQSFDLSSEPKGL